tara:strand:+ start:1178 stop:1405 length:228 start_codon:yes stop_codon:yes gene_type:complete
MKTTEYLEDLADEAFLFDGCSSAIVGHDQNGFAVYQHTKLVQIFEADGMTIDEAIEWVEFNIMGVQPQNYTILFT